MSDMYKLLDFLLLHFIRSLFVLLRTALVTYEVERNITEIIEQIQQ